MREGNSVVMDTVGWGLGLLGFVFGGLGSRVLRAVARLRFSAFRLGCGLGTILFNP